MSKISQNQKNILSRLWKNAIPTCISQNEATVIMSREEQQLGQQYITLGVVENLGYEELAQERVEYMYIIRSDYTSILFILVSFQNLQELRIYHSMKQRLLERVFLADHISRAQMQKKYQ